MSAEQPLGLPCPEGVTDQTWRKVLSHIRLATDAEWWQVWRYLTIRWTAVPKDGGTYRRLEHFWETHRIEQGGDR